jgi:hypothetical protein
MPVSRWLAEWQPGSARKGWQTVSGWLRLPRRWLVEILLAMTTASLFVGACDGDEPPRVVGAGGGSQAGDGTGGLVDLVPGGGTSGDGAGPAGGADVGGGGDREADGGGGSGASGATRGRVVDFFTKRPLRERRIFIGVAANWDGAYETTADAEGYFELPVLSGEYSAVVVEPDGSAISVYDRLLSTAPVLLHRSGGIPDALSSYAIVTGTLSGGAHYPLSKPGDVVVVHLASDQLATSLILGGGESPFGPDYAMGLSFGAHREVPATLLAIGTFASEEGDGSYTAAVGMKELVFANGDRLSVDVDLQPCELGRVAGTVVARSAHPITDVSAYYRFPVPEGRIDFPLADTLRENPLTSDGAFAYQLPDLSQFGAKLCISARSDGEVELFAERCDLALDTGPSEVTLDPEPVVSAPAPGSPLAVGSAFEWSRPGAGISLVELDPDGLSGDAPLITLFTGATRAALPDLSGLDIELVRPVPYRASVRNVSGYRSLDAAIRPEGLAAVITPEIRTGRSSTMTLQGAP